MLWSKAIGAGGAGGVVEGWNVSTATHSQSYTVSEDTVPSALFFSADGLRLYITGDSANVVLQYSLSLPWDVATSIYVRQINISEATSETEPNGIFFSPTGNFMFVCGNGLDSVYKFSLGASWDISTATLTSSTSVSAQGTFPSGVFFKEDGLKMFVTNGQTRVISEYSLSTAWDITSKTFIASLGVIGTTFSPKNAFIRPDGLKLFFIGSTDVEVNEFDLSTPWAISSATYVQTKSLAANTVNPYGLFFKGDGSKMYISDPFTLPAIHEYDLTA